MDRFEKPHLTTLTKIQQRQVKKAQELINQLSNLAKEISTDRKFPSHVAEQFRNHSSNVSETARLMQFNCEIR